MKKLLVTVMFFAVLFGVPMMFYWVVFYILYMGLAVDVVISFLISLMGSVTMFLGLVKVAEKLVNKGLDIYIIDMRR
jgi:hypothetical protein